MDADGYPRQRDGVSFFEVIFFVMPAKAGIQGCKTHLLPWTPAFAGVTTKEKMATELS